MIHPAASPHCSLCASLRDEPYRLIRRNAHAAALVIREPQVPFHALVLPVRHITCCADLDGAESRALHGLLEDLTRRMDEVLGCSALAALNGLVHRTEPHLHYQVLPVRHGLRTVMSAYLGVDERRPAEASALAAMASRVRW
jgi:diadenosine tetraphosphate (Ap4A) HIT family hydrolase